MPGRDFLLVIGEHDMNRVSLFLVFVVICLLGVPAASYGQNPPSTTHQQLLEENAALKRQVEQLSEIVEGTAHPINLGRTSLAAVTASSVNGSRTIDNQFYGARNAFDGGDNWINNINYTYWLASGGAGNWVEVHFDQPITVKYIVVEQGPPFATTFTLHKGGEATHPTVSGRLDLKRPLHGVRRVRLTFGGGRGNTQVHEIRIMGFPPPDAKYEVGRPRMLLDARTVRLLAVDRFDQWRNSLGRGVAPKTEENADRYITTYRHLETGVDLFRVTVWKKTSKVETEVLAKWAPAANSGADASQALSQPAAQDSSTTESKRGETTAVAKGPAAPAPRAPTRIRKVNHQWTPEEKAKVQGLEKGALSQPDRNAPDHPKVRVYCCAVQTYRPWLKRPLPPRDYNPYHFSAHVEVYLPEIGVGQVDKARNVYRFTPHGERLDFDIQQRIARLSATSQPKNPPK